MIVPGDETNIRAAAKLLKAGGLVAFPTETVYGLGADARNEQAISRIFQVKGRPSFNPLIVHVKSFDQVTQVADINRTPGASSKLALLARLWPGPISVVLRRATSIPAIVSGGQDSVAIRIPNHPVALRLLADFDGPIAAPSANRSNYISPTTAAHVESDLGTEIGFVLDGGNCPIGLESTVVSLLDDQPTILRPGAISVREIEDLVGPVRLGFRTAGCEGDLHSPGMLKAHYSPSTRLAWVGTLKPEEYPERVGLISFSSSALETDNYEYTALQTLSASGDPTEIASGLYSALRSLDQMGLDLIVIDPRGMTSLGSEMEHQSPTDAMQSLMSHAGLGLAIFDRLQRATAKFDRDNHD